VWIANQTARLRITPITAAVRHRDLPGRAPERERGDAGPDWCGFSEGDGRHGSIQDGGAHGHTPDRGLLVGRLWSSSVASRHHR
jgi:hypothetical protein